MTTASATGQKLLIVDDEKEVLEGIQFFFESHGVEVLTAQGGHEAMALLRACKPGLMMLDIKMQGMSGTEILQKTKELYPDVTVVMISGLSDDGIEEQCHALGAAKFLHKPVRIQELEEVVQTLHGGQSDQSSRR